MDGRYKSALRCCECGGVLLYGERLEPCRYFTWNGEYLAAKDAHRCAICTAIEAHDLWSEDNGSFHTPLHSFVHQWRRDCRAKH